MSSPPKKFFICEYCDKQLSAKNRLQSHLDICDFKKKGLSIKYIEQLTNQLKKKDEEIRDKELEIEELRFYEEEYKKLNNKYIKLLEEKSSTPSIINNTTNNTTNIQNNFNYEPIDTSQKRFDKIIEDDYDYEKYIEGPEGAKYVYLKFLSNDKGEPQALVADYSRGKIKCLDITTNKIIDLYPEDLHSFSKKSKLLNNKINDYYKKEIDMVKHTSLDDLDLINSKKLIFSNDELFKRKIFNRIRSSLRQNEKVDINELENLDISQAMTQDDIILRDIRKEDLSFR